MKYINISSGDLALAQQTMRSEKHQTQCNVGKRRMQLMAIMDRTESFGICLDCDWHSYKTQPWPQCLSIELERDWGGCGEIKCFLMSASVGFMEKIF